MAAAAEFRGHALGKNRRHGVVGDMALEAVPVFHLLAVTLVALETAQVLSVNGVTLVAFHPCMGRWMFFHGFSHAGVAAQAGCPHGLQVGKVYSFGHMRIMASGACLHGIMLFLFRIMAFGAGWNNIFFPWRMCLMAFYACQFFCMHCPVLAEILYDIIMACPAGDIFNGMVPDIPGGLMGLVTCQAVLQGEIWRMLFVAVKTGVGFALSQAVGMMALAAILFRVGTGQLFHLFFYVGMTGDTDRLYVSHLAEGGYQRGMRVVTGRAVLGCKVLVLSRVMTLRALWNHGLALGRMSFVTIHAG